MKHTSSRPESTPPDGPVDGELVDGRAGELTAEEKSAGVDDPSALAEAVLADSEARTLDRTGTAVEHRTSEDTVDPRS